MRPLIYLSQIVSVFQSLTIITAKTHRHTYPQTHSLHNKLFLTLICKSYRHTNKHTHKHTHTQRYTGRHTARYTASHTLRHTYIHKARHTDRHTHIKTNKKAWNVEFNKNNGGQNCSINQHPSLWERKYENIWLKSKPPRNSTETDAFKFDLRFIY